MVFKGLSKLLGRSRAAVRVAVFGKHPGWDDHIDDIGLESPALIALKRTLYVEGIARQVDAGAWDALAPEARLDSFGHALGVRTPESVVAAQVWQSRDGKGRDRYPMVACAELEACDRVPPIVWTYLTELRRRCTEATTAHGVRDLLSGADAILAARLAGAPDAVPASDAVAGTVASESGWGGAGEGFLRALYQLDAQPGARPDPRGRSAASPALQARVPRCAPSATGAVDTWLAFIALIRPDVPQAMVIAPDQGTWCDVFSGHAAGAQMFCVRARPEALPMTADVPYSIDPARAGRLRALADAWRGAAR